MAKKSFSILVCVFLSTLCFMISSCSDDEGNGSGVNNTLEINGERYQVEDAAISDGVSNEDVLVGRMFETKLKGSDGFYLFSMEYIYYKDGYFSFNLVEGDITDYINVETFRYITNISFSTFDYISGKVYLTRDKNTVTLDFKDYTFKNDNDRQFVVNGLVKYTDY